MELDSEVRVQWAWATAVGRSLGVMIAVLGGDGSALMGIGGNLRVDAGLA